MSDTGRETIPSPPSSRTARSSSRAPARRRRRAGGAPAAPGRGARRRRAPADAGGGKEAPLALDALMSASLNPLVAAAAPLLSCGAAHARDGRSHPNPAGAARRRSPTASASSRRRRAPQGLPNEQVMAARYVLCTLLDESAASTPWGGSGVWSAQSLLVQFHNETWGGEKVFQLLSQAGRERADATATCSS